MGRKSTFKDLSNEEKSLLELSHKKGEKHTFRQRCKIILLRNEGYSAHQSIYCHRILYQK